MESKNEEASGFPGPEGLRNWLAHEIANIMKATELRVKEASDLVARYSGGQLSAAEAADLSCRYAERWGDALPGILGRQGMSDAEILAAVDEARKPDFARRVSKTQPEGGFKKGSP